MCVCVCVCVFFFFFFLIFCFCLNWRLINFGGFDGLALRSEFLALIIIIIIIWVNN